MHGFAHIYTYAYKILWITNYQNCQEIWKYIEIIVIML